MGYLMRVMREFDQAIITCICVGAAVYQTLSEAEHDLQRCKRCHIPTFIPRAAPFRYRDGSITRPGECLSCGYRRHVLVPVDHYDRWMRWCEQDRKRMEQQEEARIRGQMHELWQRISAGDITPADFIQALP